MGTSGVILEQLGIMFLLIFFGYILVKKEVLDLKGSEQIANMLTRFVTPTVLVMSFQQEFSFEQLQLLGMTVGASILLIASRVVVNQFTIPKKDNLDRYSTVFSNSGFVGIPLVLALLGFEGVFYMTGYILVTVTAQWTYGIYAISGDKSLITPKRALTNPATTGAVVGISLYVLQISLPPVMAETLYTIGSLNTPLAMILLGTYVARSNLLQIFNSRKAYWTSFLRLILLPIVGIGILWLLPIENNLILMVLTIASCAPVAVNAALFSQLFGGDYEYGARLVILSTLLSILTIPGIIALSEWVFSV